ncbi:MAG: vWA domain-containing protein [bacterium]
MPRAGWWWNVAEDWRITAQWERPVLPLSQASENTLRIRLSPPPATTAHGLRLAVALDCSRSMVQEMRLEEAKQAVLSLAGALDASDHLHVAVYSSQLMELIRGLRGGENLTTQLKARLTGLQPRGLTRTQLALDWLDASLANDELRSCVALLITDGVPTDERGYPLTDTALLEDRVRRMRESGIRLYTVGIGESDYFDPKLLDQLAQLGGGRFIYQPHPGGLSVELRRLLRDCRGLSTRHSGLRIRSHLQGLTPGRLCRVSQDFQQCELATQGDALLAGLGVLNEDQPTELLLDLQFAASPFGSKEGERRAVGLELVQDGRVVGRLEQAVTFSNSFSSTRQVDEGVQRESSRRRLNELMRNLQDSDESRQTSRLLEQIIDNAETVDRPEIAEEARAQLSELKKTGKLTRHRATSLLSRTARDDSHD